MKVPNNLGRGDVGFNMTPMIDIVFLLIIFFLISSHLAKQDVQLQLDLPSAHSGNRLEEENARRAVVNVLADGSILFAGQEVDADKLQNLIAQRREEHGEDFEVRVRSHRDVQDRFFEPVMLACAKAGVWNVKIAVVRGTKATK